jgi:glycosyltransferase involved in cell wall biosynthesis
VLAPNGYDSQLFDPSRYNRTEIRNRYGIDFPLAIYIGKITPMYYKFLEPAVEAMVKVNRELPDVQFWIYGDGPEKERLESFAKEQGGKVFFKGYIEHELVPEIVTMADAGINAYDTESLKMKEWLAMGLPVISPPQVPDDSVIKTCWDADDIARTIIEVVRSPKRVWAKVPSWEDTAGIMLNSLKSKGTC